MKRCLFTALALLCAVSALAGDPMTLESGSLAALADAGNTVFFKVDYSNVKVHNDGNVYTLYGYLEQRGSDFVEDWDSDSARAHSYLTVRYNQKNKKGAQALEMEGDYNVLGTVYLTDMDFGNGGSSFIPMAGAKAGGCIISGKIVFTDDNDSEIAVLPFTEVKGVGHVSETVRLGMCYSELMNELGDLLKKESKKK